MNQITVNRSVLLEKIKANRESHRNLFLEAQQGYREDVIKELDTMLQEARDGKEIRRSVALTEPRDMTGEYDTVIAMLEMSQDDLLEISSADFQCYVLDKWGWSQCVTSANMSYIKHKL